MAQKGERQKNTQSEETKSETVEWQDASKEANGLLDRFLGSDGNGAEQHKDANKKETRTTGKQNEEQARSDEAQALV